MRTCCFILMVVIFLGKIFCQLDSIQNPKASKFKAITGLGSGYYFYDSPEFVSSKGCFVINGLIKYHIISMCTYITFSPFTNFGLMYDAYLNLGLCFGKKRFLFNVYAGTNFIGKGTKKYKFQYYKEYPNDRHEAEYSNQFNGLNPGIQALYFLKNKLGFSLNINLFRYYFYEPYQTLPYKYADRYPPYSGRNINILIGANYLIK